MSDSLALVLLASVLGVFLTSWAMAHLRRDRQDLDLRKRAAQRGSSRLAARLFELDGGK